ncbi:3-oxoacyl-[acyl-carrier-protein] reductase [Haliovirga abyssi]|uniref:3-oxoacyl-[acyl-carrier-protein] reductase n=1 Tax=Haliovirga abyssi TaxID=2996794 RepID=A0AAU9D332_9FUSO|nr:3-oxoacyl-[acyl-carrier-protein] reductase [Haliovirga abyssi]BDU50381.1 beta-ketoacyl-ACP reductase [Haliovirga abyssi]
MINLKDQIAVVTGSARGIGRAMAEKFAEAGAKVVITDILEDGEKTAQEIAEKYGVETKFIVSNVTDYESAKNLVKTTLEVFGKIDIFVNNAGITRDGLFLRMKEDDFDRVISVNLKGVFNCTQAVFKAMVKQRSGSIINISSVIGLIGNVGQTNYAASKAGILGITKSVAREGARRGIRVNAIAPGFIKTDMTHILKEEVQKQILSQIPMGEMGTPEDIANTALFLASDLSKYITGQVITIDGGMVM